MVAPVRPFQNSRFLIDSELGFARGIVTHRHLKRLVYCPDASNTKGLPWSPPAGYKGDPRKHRRKILKGYFLLRYGGHYISAWVILIKKFSVHGKFYT
jgi:hypothetical protein